MPSRSKAAVSGCRRARRERLDQSLAGDAALAEAERRLAHALARGRRRPEVERRDRLLRRAVHQEPRGDVAAGDGLGRRRPAEQLLARDAERPLGEVGPDLHVVARQVAARLGGERLGDGAERARRRLARQLAGDVAGGVEMDEVAHQLLRRVERRLARDQEPEGGLGRPRQPEAERAQLRAPSPRASARRRPGRTRRAAARRRRGADSGPRRSRSMPGACCA